MSKYKYKAADALKSYLDRKEKENYPKIMEQAKKDKKFEFNIRKITEIYECV